MASLSLTSNTYQPPSPSQGRKGGRLLNTIMEEDNEDSPTPQHRRRPEHHAAVSSLGSANMKIQAWLAPVEDHFPTPRGFNFMPAPDLPSSPSSASADESFSESTSSNPSDAWNRRQSAMTDVTEFDDLYDVSDEDVPRQEVLRNGSLYVAIHLPRPHNHSWHVQGFDVSTHKIDPMCRVRPLPRLVIPGAHAAPAAEPESWSARSDRRKMKNKLTSPVVPTPTSIVQMSPAVMSYMKAQQSLDIPTVSAPPSLDGSMTSDQLAQMSAPPTPIIDGQDEGDSSWPGVHLQPGALATLASLSSSGSEADELERTEQVIEVPHQVPEMRQQPSRLLTNLARSFVPRSPAVGPLAGLTRLEIPSPGGFFSGLSPRSRTTWHWPAPAPAADEPAPPTSTTAEQFYKAPWNKDTAPPMPTPTVRALHMPTGNFSSSPVEQVVEMPVKQTEQDDLPTAIAVQQTPVTAIRLPDAQPSDALATVNEEPPSPVDEVVSAEMVVRNKQLYAAKQREREGSHADRTERWLLAQRAYLKGVDCVPEVDTEDEEEPGLESATEDEEEKEEERPMVPTKDVVPAKQPGAVVEPTSSESRGPEAEVAVAPTKKSVRFSEIVKAPALPLKLPSKLVRQESAYYRAFTDYMVRAQHRDAFVNRLPRFEALQAQRVSLREAHRNQLLGKYQLSVVPLSAKKRMSTNVVRGDDVVTDDPEKLRADKEREALAQASTAAWHVAATKMLNGGRLIGAPVHKRLARMSRMTNSPEGRTRILDLGGQTTCDWAWHAALQYPNTKVYTVTTKAIRQLSNCNVRGPPNHRQVAVPRLTRLPFADNQFDLISARELHSVLKFVGENGEDEWESCLRECMRVLKPGGFLEFSVMDSDVINAGPLGNAKA
ncbi:verprolin, partial [Magnaporthiopsis poae ATCC 64411]